MKNMILTTDDILTIHHQVIKLFGGIDGIRDIGSIDSVINGIYQTFDGVELYPSITDKASFLVYGLIKNHAFADGNKRTGVAAMLVFLQMQGSNVEFTNEELIDLGLSIAKSEFKQPDISEWIESHHVSPQISIQVNMYGTSLNR